MRQAAMWVVRLGHQIRIRRHRQHSQARTLCLVLGFGGSKGQVRMAIFTSCSSLGICGRPRNERMKIPGSDGSGEGSAGPRQAD